MAQLQQLDWIVLIGTLLFIVVYGVWKSRGQQNIDSYLLGDKQAKWWMVGLSVMATQASAITFLSTPGQAYSDGMQFVQFYFGMPIAMVILCITFIPIYFRLKVYTAYEYLETRFDIKTRLIAAFLFLIQRGLGAGITIYAPAIILTTIMGWSLRWTTMIIGSLVILYTVSGGSKAVNQTQKLQMVVIMGGMFVVFLVLLNYLPEGWTLTEALHLAGANNKMNVIDTSFDLNNRYTLFSGVLGSVFLFLAYFGTDQSQVQRYLTGSSITESRMGLLFNGLLKIPMQFFILLVGIMVFIFYQFHRAPIFFNENVVDHVYETDMAGQLRQIEAEYDALVSDRAQVQSIFKDALEQNNDGLKASSTQQLQTFYAQENDLREQTKSLIKAVDASIETNDRDYVFLHFFLHHLPKGLVGLLLAVIFSAAMSSSSAELNSLSSTTTVDMYKRLIRPQATDKHYLYMSKAFTFFWGIVAVGFAFFASLAENLIQFVNIVGSLFYGTILGIFMAAFYVKRITAWPVFLGTILSEATILILFFKSDISFLWLNPIGCFLVIGFSLILQPMFKRVPV